MESGMDSNLASLHRHPSFPNHLTVQFLFYKSGEKIRLHFQLSIIPYKIQSYIGNTGKELCNIFIQNKLPEEWNLIATLSAMIHQMAAIYFCAGKKSFSCVLSSLKTK